jgi:hypothetical protein
MPPASWVSLNRRRRTRPGGSCAALQDFDAAPATPHVPLAGRLGVFVVFREQTFPPRSLLEDRRVFGIGTSFGSSFVYRHGLGFKEESMSDAKLEAFEDAVGDLGDRVSELLAEASDLTQMVEAFDVDVDLTMVLPNKVDTRTKLAGEYLEAFHAEYPNAIAPEHIPYSQDIRNAVDGGQTALALEEPSTAAEDARDAFEADARALVNRLGGA